MLTAAERLPDSRARYLIRRFMFLLAFKRCCCWRRQILGDYEMVDEVAAISRLAPAMI